MQVCSTTQVVIAVGSEKVGQILGVGNVTSSLKAILLSCPTPTSQPRGSTAVCYITKAFNQPRNFDGLQRVQPNQYLRRDASPAVMRDSHQAGSSW